MADVTDWSREPGLKARLKVYWRRCVPAKPEKPVAQESDVILATTPSTELSEASDRPRPASAPVPSSITLEPASAPKIAETVVCEATENVCAICFLAKETFVLEHIDAPAGDFSSHRCCADCAASFSAHSCPWCRGKIGFVLTPPLRQWVTRFVDSIARHGRTDQHGHAAWFETWEMLELEHGSFVDAAGVQTLEGRPDVVARVGALVVQEPRFAALLQDGIGRVSGGNVAKCKSWLHNGAAIVFRLHALLADGSLAVSPALGDRLRAAYEAIFQPLERFSKPLDAHGAILGGLYMQAIMAWTSAYRCGSSSEEALRGTVRRTGTAVAKLVGTNRQKAGEVRQHVRQEFLALTHAPVWGGEQNDPVSKVLR